MTNIQKNLGKDSGWITDSVKEHIINISKCSPLAGSNYSKLSKELNHSKKVHPADHHPAGIRKIKKLFKNVSDFWRHKILSQNEDIHKIEEKKFYWHCVFRYDDKEKYLLDMSKNIFKKQVDLLFFLKKRQNIHCLCQRFL